MIDGVLLIDKPAGPTSHDVVARMRRALGERRMGHTGTLDPGATGLLPLVIGRATRIASLLTGGDKVYVATIRLGQATTTDDAEGEPVGPPAARLPDDAAILEALEPFRGEIAQVPPSHSAKKVAGRRAYVLARRDQPAVLPPVTVTVRELAWLGRAGSDIELRLTVSAGFYVRALARDLGVALGCGAHLRRLRRTGSGPFSVDRAVALDEAERLGPAAAGLVVSPVEALAHLPSVRLTAEGLRRALHGNYLSPQDLEERHLPPPVPGAAVPVRLLGADGRLVALGHARGGALHPVVVLG
jgi:tRNA pseudouridine55 synthase